jgi:hypothetical protein
MYDLADKLGAAGNYILTKWVHLEQLSMQDMLQMICKLDKLGKSLLLNSTLVLL